MYESLCEAGKVFPVLLISHQGERNSDQQTEKTEQAGMHRVGGSYFMFHETQDRKKVGIYISAT